MSSESVTAIVAVHVDGVAGSVIVAVRVDGVDGTVIVAVHVDRVVNVAVHVDGVVNVAGVDVATRDDERFLRGFFAG